MRKLTLTIALALLGLAAPTAANAAPIFNLGIHHNQTNFPPGGNQALAAAKVFTATEGSATTNEQQGFRLLATSGTFTLSFDPDGDGPLPAETTADLPFGANGAAVQAALESLPSIGAGNVAASSLVDNSGDTSYTVNFIGALAQTDVTQLVVGDGATPLTIESEYWVELVNVGPDPTSGPITVTVNLPAGITRRFVHVNSNEVLPILTWSCPGSVNDKVIVCTTTGTIPRHELNRQLKIKVNVAAPEGAIRTLKAKVSGGGAAEATAEEVNQISSTPAPFGIVAPSFVPDFFQADGLTPEREAGAHPDLFTVPFDFNSVDFPTHYLGVDTKRESDSIRNLHVDTPPGFIGNPSAVGECPQAALTLGACPPSSQVGRIEVTTTPPISNTGDYHTFNRPVYNLVHPRGAVTDLAFVIAGNPVHIRAFLDPANRYAITTHVPDINETLPPFDQKLTLWGVPAEHSHDSERCPPDGTVASLVTSNECSTDFEPRPFLALPSQCEDDNIMRLHHYDSWQNTGDFGPDINYTMPGLMDRLRQAHVRTRPWRSNRPASRPTRRPASTSTSRSPRTKTPMRLATPPVQAHHRHPARGDELQPVLRRRPQVLHPGPDATRQQRAGAVPRRKRGSAKSSCSTPLLPKRAGGLDVSGSPARQPLRLAPSPCSWCSHDTEERGVLVKIPGRIDVDPTTGQITTVFEDTPQFPFDDLTLKFRSGPRAPLVTPPSCGTQTIGVEVASYAQPTGTVDASNNYQVNEGPNGTPCPPDPASRPFHPTFNGGTLNPVAGAFSTFLFRLHSDRRRTGTEPGERLVLPPGLVAKIAGVPFCPDQAIASISTEEGTGAAEQANPACPASSLPRHSQRRPRSRPRPQLLRRQGLPRRPLQRRPAEPCGSRPRPGRPLRPRQRSSPHSPLRRPRYLPGQGGLRPLPDDPARRPPAGQRHQAAPRSTRNNDQPDQLPEDGRRRARSRESEASLHTTADDSLFNTSTPFQVGSCGDLSFKPKLAFRLFGGTKRGSHPKFRATLTMPPGGANIAAASVALPKSEFLDQGHIKTICTRVQFAAEACPAGSIYGTVSARTPLLDETLHGNIYLRSSSNPLPDLVAAFRGGTIDANVVGRIDSINGGIRNTFDFVPDVPVSEAVFTFAGGKKGLLVNSRNICNGTFRATAKFKGQNGATKEWRPKMVAKCPKGRKGAKGKKRRG